MPFSDIANIFLPVYFDVVPGLIFRRTASRHYFIPLFSIFEFRIDAQHDSVVIKLFMAD